MIIMVEGEEELQKNYQELKENKRALINYIREQCVDESIEKLGIQINNCIQKRLINEVLRAPDITEAEKVFIEIDRLEEDEKQNWCRGFCTSILDLLAKKQIDENEAFSLYFLLERHIGIVDEKYMQYCAEYKIKFYKQEIQRELAIEVVKEGADLFSKHFPKFLNNFSDMVFREILGIYALNTSCDQILPDDIIQVLEILIAYSTGKLEKKLYDLYIQQLKLKIERNFQEDIIKKLFRAVNSANMKEKKEAARFVCNKCGEKILYHENCQQPNIIKVICLRNMILQHISYLQLKRLKEIDYLNETYRSCLEKHFRNYLIRDFCPDTIERILKAVQVYQYFDQTNEQIYEVVCNTVLEKFQSDSLSSEEIYQIYKSVDHYIEPLGALSYWYRQWESEQEEKKNYFKSSIKKFASSKVEFSSFLSKIYVVENQNPLTIITENSKEKMDFYVSIFFGFYEHNEIGIELNKKRNLFEISTQIFLYGQFLKKISKSKVFFYEKKEKRIEEVEIEMLERVLHIIKKAINGIPFEQEEKKLNEESKRCAALLLPYCKLTKTEYKNLRHLEDAADLSKIARACGRYRRCNMFFHG